MNIITEVMNPVKGCNTENSVVGYSPPLLLYTLGVTYVCDGCQLQSATFTTSSVSQLIDASKIGLCVQVAFVVHMLLTTKP